MCSENKEEKEKELLQKSEEIKELKEDLSSIFLKSNEGKHVFGEIYQYTYRITDKYSGTYLRTEKSKAVVGAETFGLNQLMRVNSNGSITVGNIDNNAVKTYASLSAYKNALEAYSYACKNVIYF